jgi:hypothetical protein
MRRGDMTELQDVRAEERRPAPTFTAVAGRCIICGEVVTAPSIAEFERKASIHYSAEHCG